MTQLRWLAPFGEGRPYGANTPAVAKWILGGWKITQILRLVPATS